MSNSRFIRARMNLNTNNPGIVFTSGYTGSSSSSIHEVVRTPVNGASSTCSRAAAESHAADNGSSFPLFLER